MYLVFFQTWVGVEMKIFENAALICIFGPLGGKEIPVNFTIQIPLILVMLQTKQGINRQKEVKNVILLIDITQRWTKTDSNYRSHE